MKLADAHARDCCRGLTVRASTTSETRLRRTGPDRGRFDALHDQTPELADTFAGVHGHACGWTVGNLSSSNPAARRATRRLNLARSSLHAARPLLPGSAPMTALSARVPFLRADMCPMSEVLETSRSI